MAKETTVGQRVSELIAQLDISKNAFAMSLDKTATVVQHLVDERNKPGFDLLCKIFEIYPNVSKDWLMLGTGSMFVTKDLPLTEEPAEAPTPPPPVPKEAPAAKPVPPAAEPAPQTAPAASAPAPEAPAPPTPVAAVPPAPAAAPAANDSGWQNALYTQQMAHQLAMADMRNQFLQEQQRMMQQMMDLMQRQLKA